MKQIHLGILIGILCVHGLIFSQNYPITPYKLISSDYNSVAIKFFTDNYKGEIAIVDNDTFSVMNVPGYENAGEPGLPALPATSCMIEVPICDRLILEVEDARYDTVNGSDIGLHYPIMPMQPAQQKNEPSYASLKWNKNAYGENHYIGGEVAKCELIGIARSKNIAMVTYTPVRYNPINNQFIICTQAHVRVSYEGVDESATYNMKQLHYSPAYSMGAECVNELPLKSAFEAAPIRYLIVAHDNFKGQLDTLVRWKQRKGYITDVVYTDNPMVGHTADSIKAYIQSQYTQATADHPAPTYLLLVGDVQQIPAFQGNSAMTNHVTDLYYACWTAGDYIPDCHYGRMSAQNLNQLLPQIEKTLKYEQYQFQDPSFLNHALLVSGIDNSGISPTYAESYADPAMDYLATMYVNSQYGYTQVPYYKNVTSVVPTASGVTVYSNYNASSNVRNVLSAGVGLACYSGHGTADGWFSPSFINTHVSTMTNNNKYGVMIGNCCLSNKYDDDECLGEALLRKGNNSGAVAYIGATNSTHWMQDFYFAVGIRAYIYNNMTPVYDPNFKGAYDKLFHTHNESFTDYCHSMGSIIMAGNMSIQNSTTTDTSYKHYYWEIYNLMGDPSLMPWLKQADTIAINIQDSIAAGDSLISVQASPYALVALTQQQYGVPVLIASAYANANGTALLTIPGRLYAGRYEVAASAQNKQTAFKSIVVRAYGEANVEVSRVEMSDTLVAGDSVMCRLVLVNSGISTARHSVVSFSARQSLIPGHTLTIDSIAAHDSTYVDIWFMVPANMRDQELLECGVDVSWDNCSMPLRTLISGVVNAPMLTFTLQTTPSILQAGCTARLTLIVTNKGHADLNNATLHFHQPLPMINLVAADTVVTLCKGGSITGNYTATFGSSLPTATELPFFASFSNSKGYSYTHTLPLSLGAPTFEDFESGTFANFNWQQDANAWEITSATSHTGNYCAKSKTGLANNASSTLSITWTSSVSDSISFYYKVSSENNDMFYFIIDNDPKFLTNGSMAPDWTYASYPVSAGTHTFTFTYIKDYFMASGSDCSWIDDIHFPSAPVTPHSIIYTQDTVCQYAVYVYDGDTINTNMAGAYNYGRTLQSNDIEVLQLYVSPSAMSYEHMIACDEYYWNGRYVKESGTYTDTLASSQLNGCDSVVVLYLTVNHSVYDTISKEVEDSVYTWNNVTYTESGVYTQTFVAVSGCDSTVTLYLTLTPLPDDEAVVSYDGKYNIKVYPNPASHIIHIEWPTDTEARLIEIYTLQGSMCISVGHTQNVDVSALAAGVYFMRIYLTSGVMTAPIKLIKL